MISIEVLTFADCPHRDETLQLVRRVVHDERVDAVIEERLISSADEASREQFPGSPTVRVNGRDIDSSAGPGQAFGFACRTYENNDERTGVPPRALIAQAIRAAKLPLRTRAAFGSATLSAGAALTAAAVTVCCTAPVVATGLISILGVGGAAAATMLTPYAPYFFAFSLALILFGFWSAYRRPPHCAVPRIARVSLWIAAVIFAASLVYSLASTGRL